MSKKKTDEKEVLQKVGELIAEKPLRDITVDIHPKNFIDKVLMKYGLKPKQAFFEIKPQRFQNIYRIASKAVKFDLGVHWKTDDKIAALFDITSRHYNDVVYIVACVLQNNHKEPTKKIISLVADDMDMLDIHAVLAVALNSYHLNSFISTIGLIVGVDALSEAITPKPSPVEKGS